MENLIQDAQLEFELQELYLVSKHWHSDVAFMQDELRFLKSLVSKNWEPMLADPSLKEMRSLHGLLITIEERLPVLTRRIDKFLHVIELLITSNTQTMDVELINTFAGIESAVNHAIFELKGLKSNYFRLTEAVMKYRSSLNSCLLKMLPEESKSMSTPGNGTKNTTLRYDLS